LKTPPEAELVQTESSPSFSTDFESGEGRRERVSHEIWLSADLSGYRVQ
jgi:hypothetical protein